MAGAAFGITGMVKGHRRPVMDPMAIRTLPRPVHAFYVAGLAIHRAAVIETDRLPILGAMAICAGFSVMRQGRRGMARRAVHQSAV